MFSPRRGEVQVFGPARDSHRLRLAVVILALVMAWIGVTTPWAAEIEGWLWDQRIRLLAKDVPSDLAIRLAVVDDQTREWAEQGEKIPPKSLPRELYGALIVFCREAGVRALVWTDELDEPSVWGEDDDQRLAEAMDRAGWLPIFLPLHLGEGGGRASWPDDVAKPFEVVQAAGGRELPAEATGSFPIVELARAATAMGHVSVHDGTGRTVRKIRPLLVFDDAFVPFLGLAAFSAITGGRAGETAAMVFHGHQFKIAGKLRIPLDEKGFTALRYRRHDPAAGPYLYPSVRVSDLIDAGRLLASPVADRAALGIDMAKYKGSVVVLGQDARLRTPIGWITMPELHATVLDNLFTRSFLRPPSQWVRVLLALAFALAAAASWCFPLRWQRLTATVVCLLSVPAMGWGAFLYGYWWPVAEPLLASILAIAVVVAWSRSPPQRLWYEAEPTTSPGDASAFDVFVSYNGRNRAQVRQLAKALAQRDLKVWFDEWELIPGRPWQEALEEIVRTTRSVAVVVGRDGLGPWETAEMRACLNEFVTRDLPVIPVLLPGVSEQPELPLLLNQFTWVDLRPEGLSPQGLDRLVWGITGARKSASRAPL